ncbi:hypothetical protein ACIBCS_04365 [Streptomyces phaeochromogenes]|uniref:hypothetical protein n=1 Tax=Streptomyces phaeochromogenes TaxID=1923 RepID=UPI0033D75D97
MRLLLMVGGRDVARVDTQVAIVAHLHITGQGGDEPVASVSARLFLAVEQVSPAERANAHMVVAGMSRPPSNTRVRVTPTHA